MLVWEFRTKRQKDGGLGMKELGDTLTGRMQKLPSQT
jgi:hypothetical protein